MTCGADEGVTVCDAPNCLVTMTAREVYAYAAIEGAKVVCCSESCLQSLAAAEAARVACTYCTHATTTEDRVPVTNGGVPGYAHAGCLAKVSNAVGWERSRMLSARGVGALVGGRTVGMVRRTGPLFAAKGRA